MRFDPRLRQPDEAISATTYAAPPITAAAYATCIGCGPLNRGESNSVFSVAAIVPIMRPPTFVAKLPPVPRRCSGNTLGRNSLRKLNWATVSRPQKKMAAAKTTYVALDQVRR